MQHKMISIFHLAMTRAKVAFFLRLVIPSDRDSDCISTWFILLNVISKHSRKLSRWTVKSTDYIEKNLIQRNMTWLTEGCHGILSVGQGGRRVKLHISIIFTSWPCKLA
ncbi:hypothetical protein SK128_004134 [Halocaridina rubra]|uniref:Uncharacterized protein n=1 Tax=Halocaridina rubra TaxID=373956 RepID=A0AAN8X4F7_HALRR